MVALSHLSLVGNLRITNIISPSLCSVEPNFGDEWPSRYLRFESRKPRQHLLDLGHAPLPCSSLVTPMVAASSLSVWRRALERADEHLVPQPVNRLAERGNDSLLHRAREIQRLTGPELVTNDLQRCPDGLDEGATSGRRRILGIPEALPLCQGIGGEEADRRRDDGADYRRDQGSLKSMYASSSRYRECSLSLLGLGHRGAQIFRALMVLGTSPRPARTRTSLGL